VAWELTRGSLPAQGRGAAAATLGAGTAPLAAAAAAGGALQSQRAHTVCRLPRDSVAAQPIPPDMQSQHSSSKAPYCYEALAQSSC
jgi:hypothetical protein